MTVRLVIALFEAIGIKLHSSKKSFYTLSPIGHCMHRTAVTVCTSQRSLYVPHGGHYMYRTAVTVRTAQWSLYVPHSGHYMYRTVVTHYMYHTAVTICTAQRSLYVPPV